MREEILQRLAGLIREVVDEPWIEDVPITFETSFNEDLDLESIEFVALAERIQSEFGAEVDFTGWLGDKELSEIIALRVGELVDFIVTCRSSNSAA
jgi:acyl carrier protein